MATGTRAALYVRLSQDRLGTELGVTRQLDDARRYAEQQGWTVVAEFRDNDLSATRGKHRPGYADLMAAADGREFDWIVVWHQSRIWRNRRERADGIERLKVARVSLGAVKGPDLDLTTAQGRMLAGLLGEVDTAEVEIKGERQAAAGLQSAQQGRPTGGPRPFGYLTGGMEIDRVEAPEIKAAVSGLLAGQSLGSLVRDLNSRGVRTSLGKEWSGTQLRAVLLRPRNAGLRSYRGEVIGAATWPAVIDEASWRAVAALISDPARRTSPGFARRHLGSGLYVCGTCGETVTSAGTAYRGTDGTRRRTVYRCRSRKHVARHVEPVDDLVSEVVVARLSRSDAREILLVDDRRPDAADLKAEALALRSRLDELASMFASGAVTGQQLRTASHSIRAQLAEVETRQGHASRVLILTDLVGAADVRRVWNGLSLDRRRAVIDTLMTVTIRPQVTQGARQFDPDLIDIDWRS